MKSLGEDPSVRLVAADMDPWAAGLYLVPSNARTLVPAGLDPAFVDAVHARCIAMDVDILVPTVDAEMRPLGPRPRRFRRAGIELLLAPDDALDVCLDKLALAECCSGQVPVPRTERLDKADPAAWTYPVVVKPRTGSGSPGRLGGPVRRGTWPGCLPRRTSWSRSTCPARSTRSTCSPTRTAGWSPPCRGAASGSTPGSRWPAARVHDEQLERLGAAVVEATGLTYISNVQFRRDAAGQPALLEVNPRVPGALPLTMASGVDMPRMAMDSLRGRPLPEHADFHEMAMVRFLEERFIELGEVREVAA